MAQARQEATRQRLIDAAYSLFDKHGFDNVTVSQIATAAGVSRRTFFRYFSSKESVIFPFTEVRIAFFRNLIRKQTGGRPARPADIRTILSELLQSWVDNRELMLTGRRIIAESTALRAVDFEVYTRWERALALEFDGAGDLIEDEGVEPSLMSAMIAGVIIGAMWPVFRKWQASKGTCDLVADGHKALDLVEQGILDAGGPEPQRRED